jgi:PAS domain-containing protein
MTSLEVAIFSCPFCSTIASCLSENVEAIAKEVIMAGEDIPLEIESTATQDTSCDLAMKHCERKSILYAALNASLNGIIITDPHMHILYFNPGFCTMWDLSKEEVQVGVKMHKVLEHCIKKTLAPEMLYLSLTKIHHSKDMIWKAHVHLSNKKVFQSSSSPVRGVDGTYYGRIWEFIDITEMQL